MKDETKTESEYVKESLTKKKMGSNDIYVSEILKKDDELDLSISLSQLIG